ncbi:proline--tRNA ligase [Kitasatospora sp. NBC_01266]|uniref:proline--tRNA ligase n=1 Tax=Kitasatospora sp. NBC_01266 TaxID=2903572 RepID=UPI002E32C589|nr:proline--tRNA ligase [Kitasatospora sp. NBC_01266]
MRWSQMHIPTLRETPADADAPSHRLLLRAGYVKQLMAGHYSLLPLAVRVRAKVIRIIREEMDAIGAQEFLLPTMHPAEVWQRSGRWATMGEEMFRLKDRKGADLALGMTHEEIFSTLAADLSSYRQLPQIWYQFQTKFRDEPRPKAGLMRTREFTMKDAYSFDLASQGLDTAFDRQRAAYLRIFARLGIPAIPVEASSGTMGGSTSTEFMCPAEVGEDFVVHCPECGYAANVEKATSRLSVVADGSGAAEPERFDTPGVRTIEDLATGFGAAAERQVKTLVYLLDERLTLVLLRGDHALAEQKLIDATGANAVRPARAEEIQAALGALPGSLGAVGLSSSLPVLADEALRGRRAMFTGANVDGVHLRGVEVERDIAVGQWADLREVAAGEPCVSCGSALQVQKAIEIGHIFKLGYKYSEAFGLTVQDAAGAPVNLIMGSYGIGVERAMAAAIECHHDEKGIVWPLSIAPFAVAVVIAQPKDEQTAKAGEEIYRELLAAGVEVIVDDRDERLGVKFADVELVGIPLRVTVGKRGLAEGVVELTSRATGETERVPLDEIAERVRKAMAAGSDGS